ncbi:hypothetical protein K503DRAFT_224228 [Rhizopogon vinicolor AM-OR11-026]|uniref:Uncharacterized protein n=1 Tax=Rhizopogon vinicolor AM-OR11-026 TaxID=1314800 RepID=A0A1B7NE95_9AGAM|nr:hypothetical protein K503DRAFT_224228 [Rhizopogon vinicolor AM-OR11-026]
MASDEVRVSTSFRDCASSSNRYRRFLTPQSLGVGHRRAKPSERAKTIIKHGSPTSRVHLRGTRFHTIQDMKEARVTRNTLWC